MKESEWKKEALIFYVKNSYKYYFSIKRLNNKEFTSHMTKRIEEYETLIKVYGRQVNAE